MSNPHVGEKAGTGVGLDGTEMANRAAAAASLLRRTLEIHDPSQALPLGRDETVKLGLLARQGSEIYLVRHRHNAVKNGFASDASGYEQVDTYYFIDSVRVPTSIEVYEDDLERERTLLEEGHYDQLKYWMGEKEAIFAQRTHSADEREAQLLSRTLHQLV